MAINTRYGGTMKVGDLVQARYNTSKLGIIMEIKRKHYGFKEVIEFTVLWNCGFTGYLYGKYLVPVKKCP